MALQHFGAGHARWCTLAGAYLEFFRGGLAAVRPEREAEQPDRVAAAVSASVQRMLVSLERDLDRADDRIGERLHVLDRDGDGVISRSELAEALQFLGTELSAAEMQTLEARLSESGSIRVDELAALHADLAAARASGSAAGAEAPR